MEGDALQAGTCERVGLSTSKLTGGTLANLPSNKEAFSSYFLSSTKKQSSLRYLLRQGNQSSANRKRKSHPPSSSSPYEAAKPLSAICHTPCIRTLHLESYFLTPPFVSQNTQLTHLCRCHGWGALLRPQVSQLLLVVSPIFVPG